MTGQKTVAPTTTPDDGLNAIIAHGNRHPYRRGEPYRRGPNWFKTGDGSKISVIAGWGTYCSPRPDWPGGVPDDYAGPYDAVEAWLPGSDDPATVDVDELRAWIAAHGGLVAGPAEYESDLAVTAPAAPDRFDRVIELLEQMLHEAQVQSRMAREQERLLLELRSPAGADVAEDLRKRQRRPLGLA